ncbi:hypothetical protein OC846_002727 [Tilletia horrida]|uniref:Acid phosphatase n=1 Tax=Tilletia horrida TaxID=155126 RepID=A0AAN6JSP7_9BASI|nr:hypothetical protein OC846_002727 [Tilletia horrida]KAK0567220.1 hypothetical protein OC861_002817 [Tilletia horrida]
MASDSAAQSHPYPVPLYADGSSTFPSPLPIWGGGSTAKSADLGWTPPPPDSRLELAQVHFYLRHGERTPVRTRLENSRPAIPSRWNLCHASSLMRANVLQLRQGQPAVETLPVQRIVEASSSKLVPSSPLGGECLPGELTNLGRMTTFEIGTKLRSLYVDRLGFIPDTVTAGDQDLFLFRSTNMSRTVETCQQAIAGLLPTQAREQGGDRSFVPRILVKNFLTETLLPNTLGCSRFRNLDRHYAEQAALKHNPQLEALDATLASHNDGFPIRVDGHPRLSGLFDTIRAADAHGYPVPEAFVAPTVIELVNRAIVSEWFSGYYDPDTKKATEFKRLAMGRLLTELQTQIDAKIAQPEQNKLKLGIYSTHDTTLAGILCTLDVFDHQWPSFAASVNFELFRRAKAESGKAGGQSSVMRFFGLGDARNSSGTEEHFIRVRYGDQTLRLPACAGPGKHLDGHEEFCTVDAFREIVESLRHPDGLSWEAECEAGTRKGKSNK